MSQLVVRTTMGSLTAWHELAPAFTRLTGHKVIVAQEDATTLDAVLASNAQSDLVSLYGEPLNRIVKSGKTVGGASTIFTRAAVGLSVKAGAPWPDISTPEAFKKTLLNAKSITYSFGGSGQIAARAIEKLGIKAEMAPRTVRSVGGAAAAYIARGEVEMAIQQFNVSKPVAGTDYVGDLPGELHEYVVFEVAVLKASKEQDAARALIQFVTSPQAAPLLREAMLEPAG